MNRKVRPLFLLLVMNLFAFQGVAKDYDVLVIGGGASGVCAAVQSARLGSRTILIDDTPWLGGMLTSAGVSATDGNFRLPSGLWGDFIDELVSYYGSLDALRTGWVSNIQFEPSVGNTIFQRWVKNEKLLTYCPNTRYVSIKRLQNGWDVVIQKGKQREHIKASYIIDATELGDVAKEVGLSYRVGLDAREQTNEKAALAQASNTIQDITYVMILKEYDEPHLIKRPDGYTPYEFRNCCINPYNDSTAKQKPWSQEMMITYGKLPNRKYMINWPMFGNDIYLNDIEYTPERRRKLHKQAKARALRFLYFMQHELEMKNFGLADEYPTADKLPFYPYYREGRRFEGRVMFTLNDILYPYEQCSALYRTAVAVGDYPVDQHHNEREVEGLELPSIPSWGLPMGVFFPKTEDRLLLAEKAISVTNLVNGTTRLQPVVLQIGQVAGTLAGMAVREGCSPHQLSVRKVQTQLLSTGNYLLPYLDVKKSSPLFQVYQRIGATGILRGIGKHVGWSNETWLEVDSVLCRKDLSGLISFYHLEPLDYDDSMVSVDDVVLLITKIARKENIVFRQDVRSLISECFGKYGFKMANHTISRGAFATVIDQLLHPFEAKDCDLFGNLQH